MISPLICEVLEVPSIVENIGEAAMKKNWSINMDQTNYLNTREYSKNSPICTSWLTPILIYIL